MARTNIAISITIRRNCAAVLMKYRKNSKWHTLSFMGIEKCVCARIRTTGRIADDDAAGKSVRPIGDSAVPTRTPDGESPALPCGAPCARPFESLRCPRIPKYAHLNGEPYSRKLMLSARVPCGCPSASRTVETVHCRTIPAPFFVPPRRISEPAHRLAGTRPTLRPHSELFA